MLTQAARIAAVLWTTPLALVGLALALFWYHPGSVSILVAPGATCRLLPLVLAFSDTRTMIGRPRGQTFGWVLFFHRDRDVEDQRLLAHELAHAEQAANWGPLFAVAYVVEFLARYLRHPSRGWRAAYRAISWEVRARAIAERTTVTPR